MLELYWGKTGIEGSNSLRVIIFHQQEISIVSETVTVIDMGIDYLDSGS